jgi:hypothetical protein
MKSFYQILAERVLPLSLSLEINKRERKHYKGKNMYKVVKSLEEIDEPIENVDIRKNIIICSRENDTLIRQNIDGTFSLILNRDENLSAGKSAMQGNMSVVEYAPVLKMCIPQGLKINVDDPSFEFCYFDKIYPECKIFYPEEKVKDSRSVGFSTLPSNYFLTDFKFTFHIDVHRLRDISRTFLLKKGQGIASMYFIELPHFKQYGGELEDIIYIKNDEVFKTFWDIF